MSTAKKYPLRKDLGEFLVAPKKDPNDPNEKPRYYIKITAKEDIIAMLTPGTVLELEAPEDKYHRMIKSGKLTEEQAANAEKSIGKIPKFFVKRVVAKIKQD